MRIAPIGPERHGEPDKENHSQNQKQCGLLDPRDRGNRQRQCKAEKDDLKRQQVDTGEERTERQQYEEDETGGQRRQHLLHARKQHDVHRHQNSQPMQRLSPHQSKASLLVLELRPLSNDAYEAHHNGQKLPITNERLLRKVGISHAPDCQREYGEERQLSANQAERTGAVIPGSVT